MLYHYSLNDELKDFYKMNREYLMFLYKTQKEFIDEIMSENNHEMTRYDILMTNIKVSQNKYTRDDDALLYHLTKQLNESSNMKEYNKLDKEIKKLNNEIYKKRKFIKMFFMNLQV